MGLANPLRRLGRPVSSWRPTRASRLSALLVIVFALLMIPAPGVGAMTTPTVHNAPSTPPATPAAPTLSSPAPVADRGPSPSLSGQLGHFAADSIDTGAHQPAVLNPAAAATVAPNAKPTRDTPYIPTGTFNAFVANSSDPSDFLSGVAAQAYPEQGGQFCPPFLCASENTGPSGEVNFTCPVGQSYATFNKPYWATNETFAACQQNTTVDLGTIYLLRDGIVSGRIVGDITGNPGISGVTVQGEARDFSVIASPTYTSQNGGNFSVAVPPGVAGRIDFTAPGVSYQNNFTFVTVASGQTLNLGTVYLEPNSLVEAKFYDQATHQPINGQFNFPNSLAICSSVTNTCGVQGEPGTSGNEVEAVGAPGWDYVLAEASGYLLNNSPIGYVPGTSPGHAFCVPNNCRIYLTPLGKIQFTVDVSGTPSPAFSEGLWTVSACGLDGYFVVLPKFNPVTYTYNTTTSDCLDSGCAFPGTIYTAYAIPLRNDVQVQPDTTGACGPPAQWPIPGDLPVWGNETAANVTPESTTHLGYLNLTPGSYIYGHVYMSGTTSAPPGGFAVQVQSRISNTLLTYPYQTGQSLDPCPLQGPTTFCAPAPPGPDSVVVSAAGLPGNSTWLSVPWQCCGSQSGPLLLNETTLPSIDSINLTRQAVVNGSVYVAGGTAPLPDASITACPASPTSGAACGEGLANRTGGFSIDAVPLGWDVLHASDGGYASNSEWFYTGGGTIVLPGLPLEPLATLTGYVRSTNGSAIIDASIGECTLAAGVATQTCNGQLGSGITTSDGYYQGEVVGGWLPGATYEIEASAPGYQTDWTWVNATANATTQVPNLVLSPVGAALVLPAHAGRAPQLTNPAGTWVTGRLVDNSTGEGIVTSGINACAITNGLCTQFPGGSDSGGFFNGSLPVGVYDLNVTATGYPEVTVLVSVPSGVPSFNVGLVPLAPLPWVFGRVALNPWPTIKVTPAGFATTSIQLAPPASVLGCAILCGTAIPDATSGDFQIQIYPGHGDSIFVNPSYAGSFTSAAGGFVPSVATVNITSALTNLTTEPQLDLFVEVSGTIYNAASCSEGPCTDPARWIDVTVSTSGVNNGAITFMVNGSGGYNAFLPGGDDAGATRVQASDAAMFFSKTEIVPALLGTYPGSNLTVVAPSMNVTQFGYAYVTVINNVTGLPVVGAGVSSSFNDALNGNSGSTEGKTNGAGFANITAPSGSSVKFSIGGSNDYNNTSLSAPVPIGNATDLNTYYSAGGGPVPLPPWGWVQTVYLNYTAPGNYLGSVVDKLTGQPLPGASVSIASADPTIASGGATQSTNSLGQFLADAPIGGADTLLVSLPAYQTNKTSPLNITAGLTRQFAEFNLTGDGVIASQVIAEPGNLPVSGAVVSLCQSGITNSSSHQSCVNTVTNATGRYWFDAAPGHVAITVTATGYVSNYTEYVTDSSDTWETVPAFEVVQDGLITGTVLGLPTGLPVGGASVSACSPIGGTPTGPCSFSVTALSNGSFSLPVAPSQYILATAAPGFNESYLPVSVQPGELVNLGIVPLTEYGILSGTVVNSVTGMPVNNATVGGCPIDTLLPCDAPTVTNLAGTFNIASPPGTVDLVVSASGFLNGYLAARAVSGATTTLPAIGIAPTSVESIVHVSGRIVEQADPAQAIPSATVGLWVGQSLAASTVTSSTGTFAFTVPSGIYTLTASGPGYTSASELLDLNESLSGLVLAMAPFGWSVTGTVEDGLTNAPVAGVAIWSPTAIVGMTDALGAFAVSLPNGTYNLTAVAGGASASLYAPVSFEVQVASASVNRSVLVYPASATVSGVAESSTNQSALVGAQVVLAGTVIDSAPLSLRSPTDSAGTFSFPVFVGDYTVTVSAPGYVTATVAVHAGVSNPPLTIQLTPTSTPATGASASAWGYTLVGLALIGVAVVVVAVAARRRKERSP